MPPSTDVQQWVVVKASRLSLCFMAACIGGAHDIAAQPAAGASRGELLYSTHCVGCHSTQVHWRDDRLATDWASLRMQVLRWQGNTGLAWSDDDIAAVTRYLNDLYYRFPAPGSPVALQRPLLRAFLDANPSSMFAGARSVP